MQEYYYHLCPILFENGSKILPGNWWSSLKYHIQNGGMSIASSTYISYYQEVSFEQIRSQSYPKQTTRLSSCFVFKDEIIAKFYRN